MSQQILHHLAILQNDLRRASEAVSQEIGDLTRLTYNDPSEDPKKAAMRKKMSDKAKARWAAKKAAAAKTTPQNKRR